MTSQHLLLDHIHWSSPPPPSQQQQSPSSPTASSPSSAQQHLSFSPQQQQRPRHSRRVWPSSSQRTTMSDRVEHSEVRVRSGDFRSHPARMIEGSSGSVRSHHFTTRRSAPAQLRRSTRQRERSGWHRHQHSGRGVDREDQVRYRENENYTPGH